MTTDSALFTHLPLTLFRPLAARWAPIYADILLSLFAEAVARHQPIARDYALQVVRQRLMAQGAVEQTEDALEASAPSDDLHAGDDLLSARAHVILRHLEHCGWLKPDNLIDYTQVYSLPDYAFYLLRALKEWTEQGATPLSGPLSAIHDTLTAAVREGDLASRVPQAHRQTEQLVVGLQSLYQNMGTHIDRVLVQADIRAPLVGRSAVPPGPSPTNTGDSPRGPAR